jgi:hypothetical protein
VHKTQTLSQERVGGRDSKQTWQQVGFQQKQGRAKYIAQIYKFTFHEPAHAVSKLTIWPAVG